MEGDRCYGIAVGYRPGAIASPKPQENGPVSPVNGMLAGRVSMANSQPRIARPSDFQPISSRPRTWTTGAPHIPDIPQPASQNRTHSMAGGWPMPASPSSQSPYSDYARQRSHQAYRDVDNLFGNRLFTAHSDSDEDSLRSSTVQSYHRPESAYPREPIAAATPERSRHLAEDKRRSAHGAAAPLMGDFSSPSPPRRQRRISGVALSSPPPPIHASTFPSRPSPERVQSQISLNNVLPRATSHYGDDYDGGVWDPNDIVEEDDDEAMYQPRRGLRFGKKASGMSLAARAAILSGAQASRERLDHVGSRPGSTTMLSARYQPSLHSSGAGSKQGFHPVGEPEKSEWLQKESGGAKRMKWVIGTIVVFLILAAGVGGIIGGILGSRKNSQHGLGDSSSSSSSTTESSKDGLYTINSSQVKALLNNPDLHRVFPGMDYTPLNAQYPDCLTNPPDQNNITLDVAMLAQLTPAIRLYGTDCKQTEMLLTAIDLLGYNDTMKVWMGVWLGNNATTNTRQLDQMYRILDEYPAEHFAGIIVGNEVLFREDMSITELGEQLQDVRNNLTAKSINLPVATSDLGNDWTTGLAADSDIVMANIHPFFAGVTPDVASGWAWDFWQNHNVILTETAGGNASSYPKHVISEIGWPSTGGNDCGTEAACATSTDGAVASIDNMNTFMEGWVCPSLSNGTTYFWFEAFDEPWKEIFNTATDKWESKWGLMDTSRNLKDGLKIPDCNGRTVDQAYR